MGINKDLGLPFGDGMEKVAVCFDVDGTLIDEEKTYDTMRTMLAMFVNQKWKNVKIVVWSGGGADYARTIVNRLLPGLVDKITFASKLDHENIAKKYRIIAIDDVQDTRLGDINLIVRNK